MGHYSSVPQRVVTPSKSSHADNSGALVPPGSSQQPLPLPPRPPPRPPKLRLRSEPGPPWGRLLLPACEQTAQERGRGRSRPPPHPPRPPAGLPHRLPKLARSPSSRFLLHVLRMPWQEERRALRGSSPCRLSSLCPSSLCPPPCANRNWRGDGVRGRL